MINPTQESPLRVVVEGLSDINSPGVSEWIFNIATLIIAIAGLIISIIVFSKERKDSNNQSEASRKLELMKTLILDHNMPHFYSIFERLLKSVERLKERTCDKAEVEEDIQSILRNLNETVILSFIAIDQSLYESLIIESDNCRDNLVNSLSDEGLNLYVESKYKQHVLDHINNAKKHIISKIYNYRG